MLARKRSFSSVGFLGKIVAVVRANVDLRLVQEEKGRKKRVREREKETETEREWRKGEKLELVGASV